MTYFISSAPLEQSLLIFSLQILCRCLSNADCRICVWNASDGSLVHSLTGHSESVSGVYLNQIVGLIKFILTIMLF